MSLAPTTPEDAFSDRDTQQQAFQQLQAEYLQLQQTLREQQATYQHLRLDYETQCAQLRAEKPARQQRQEKRRWQGYGHQERS